MNDFDAVSRLRAERARKDLLGAIFNSEVYDLMGFGKAKTEGEREAWEDFIEALEHAVPKGTPVNKRNNVEDRVQDFGNEREETGFRIGFHMAMSLCMQGLNRGLFV